MVPRCPQDRPKRAPGEVLGRLGGVLGRSWAALGALGLSVEGLEGLLGSLGTVLAVHDAVDGPCGVVSECDSLIEFID